MVHSCRIFWWISSVLLTVSTLPGCDAGVRLEVNIRSPAGDQGSATKDVKLSGSDIGVLTATTNVEIAVYVISCLAVLLATLCCFYICKHFCWEGCRGEASVTYQQMPPTAFNTGSASSVRVIPNGDIPRHPSPVNEWGHETTQVDMIPLQGMKKVTFASKVTSASPIMQQPPPPPYESLP